LIPGFPLDGGRVFRAAIWGATHNFRRATQVAAAVGRGIAFLFIFFGVWQMFAGNLGGGLWIAFIGWFLESAANGQMAQQNLQDLLSGHTASQAVTRNYAVIPPDMVVQQMADDHILGEGKRYFVIADNDRILGLLTPVELRRLPAVDWPRTTVRQLMTPLDQMHLIQPDEGLWNALEEMEQDGVSELPVVSGGQVMGIISRQSIANFLKLLQNQQETAPHI
jgi:CBS domain-containing protein